MVYCWEVFLVTYYAPAWLSLEEHSLQRRSQSEQVMLLAVLAGGKACSHCELYVVSYAWAYIAHTQGHTESVVVAFICLSLPMLPTPPLPLPLPLLFPSPPLPLSSSPLPLPLPLLFLSPPPPPLPLPSPSLSLCPSPSPSPYPSPSPVTLIGGVVFLLFAVTALFQDPNVNMEV